MSELRKPTKQTTCVTQSVCDLSPELTPFGISVEKYSSFIKLIRITAWMLRFVESLKGKRSDNSFLTSVELKHAEKNVDTICTKKTLLRYVQCNIRKVET
jgi:hypothetical protein